MNPQEWKEVEESLAILWSPVKLKCDGYEVTFILERISQMKNAILFYIGGVCKAKWALEDCEERRRFLCPVQKSAYTSKQKEGLKKFSKKLRAKLDIDPDKKFTYYHLYWTNFKSLKRHLIKNNKSIELVRGGDSQEGGSQKE